MKKTISSYVLLFVFYGAKSQVVTFFPGDFKPVVVWVYPESAQKEVYDAIRTLNDYKRKEYRFLFVSDSLNSTVSVTQKINDFLNNALDIDKQRVYYLEWGKGNKSRYFTNTDKDIFADFYFHSLQDSSRIFNLLKVLEHFDNHYIWESTLYEIEANNLTTIPQFYKLGFGMIYGKASQNSFENDTAYLPSSVNKLGFSLNYRINPRLYLTGRTLFSFKIPNQSKLQSSLFGQIDPFAGGIQKISLDVKAHIYLQQSLYAQYFFPTANAKKLKPFIGAGLSFSSLRSAKINEEIEIDFDDLSSGGSLPSGLDGLAAGGDLPFFTVINLEPMILAGVSYQLSKNVHFLFNAEYLYNNRKNVNGVKIENRNQNFSINAGIQFELSKKQKKYYRYLNPL